MDATVIITAYKFESFIRTAIESVLEQKTTYRFEVLICDDASPDNTEKIVREILESKGCPDHVTYVRNQKNLGMMGNLRKAFALSRGRYIFMCEGDDYWTSHEKIECQIRLMDENPDVYLTMHNGKVMWPNGDFTQASDININTSRSINQLIDDNTPTASIAFRREIIDPFPEWFEELLAFDRALKIVAAEKGTVLFLDKNMCVYRKHNDGYWTGKTFREMFITSCVNLQIINRGTRGRHRNSLRSGIKRRIALLVKDMNILERAGVYAELFIRNFNLSKNTHGRPFR
jgi:glycosyltransferase involved in cell wall biosynthesis